MKINKNITKKYISVYFSNLKSDIKMTKKKHPPILVKNNFKV